VIILENVEEFEDWGPLGPDNRPDPARVGLTFRIWKGKLEALGYKVEHRELVAADFGAPTTRKRLYLIARCDGQPIVWPEPTHDRDGRLLRPPGARPPNASTGRSSARRSSSAKRPLAENTQRRIARGIDKFVLGAAEPFIAPVTHTGDAACTPSASRCARSPGPRAVSSRSSRRR
jgi:DNA (cytosine-5)-methyltransferase 1